MFGLKEVRVLCATVVAGGVAYLIWTYATSSGTRTPKTRPKKDGKNAKEGGEGGKEEKKEEPAAPLIGARFQKASESRKPAESVGTQVLVLGLDGAGKTSLLHCLATGSLEQDTQPTQGFNAMSISRGDLHIEFLEIGGKEELRPYWQRYMSKARMLVFVVDSSEPQLLPLAKRHLHQLLASDPHLPLMVLANKQDLPGAHSITDLHEALSLSEVGDRRLFLIGTQAVKGQASLTSGIQDTWDLIVLTVRETVC